VTGYHEGTVRRCANFAGLVQAEKWLHWKREQVRPGTGRNLRRLLSTAEFRIIDRIILLGD